MVAMSEATSTRQGDAFGPGCRFNGFSGFVEDGREIHSADVEAQLAAHDLGRVDKVVDHD